MPRNVTSISIFLASPGDVAPEREVIVKAVQEWNSINSRHRSVLFELLRWESSVSAGFGTDGQAVVNEQIGDDYDALIAVFWTRLGTATPRSASGSVEEYQRAFKRYQAGEPVEIAFLFKDSLVDLRSVDLEQVSALRTFEAEAQISGAFTKSFKDVEALKFEVNLLLDRIARKLSQTALNPPQPNQQLAKYDLEKNEVEAEEPGLFDLPDQLVLHVTQSSAFLTEMTKRLEAMTSIISHVASDMEEISRVRVITPAEAKPLIDEVALGMNDFSNYLEDNVPAFAESANAMASDIRSLVDVSYDFVEEGVDNSAELIEFRSGLVVLPQAMDGAVSEIRSLLETTSGLQRTTSSFNRAKRRIIHNLNNLISTMDGTRQLVVQALTELDALIAYVQGPSATD